MLPAKKFLKRKPLMLPAKMFLKRKPLMLLAYKFLLMLVKASL